MQGIYIHIPFCQTKCIYCDFYSLEGVRAEEQFFQSLEQDIALSAAEYGISPNLVFDTIFFGGGTPSLLEPEKIDRILRALEQYATFSADAEITMECNPGTVSLASLQGYKAAGVNRLSFGVQSFFADDLQFLSRIHSPNDAEQAIHLARQAGFDNVNLDLIFALPKQTPERWRENLSRAIQLGTDHISAYSLIFEKGTPLETLRKKGKVRPAPEETEAAMYHETMETLLEHGFEQYEVSNFAKPGKKCRHNRIYWRGEPYWAVGPSAHGFWGNERYAQVRSLTKYLDSLSSHSPVRPVVSRDILDVSTLAIERVFVELRAEGVRVDSFYQDFGVSITELPMVMKKIDIFQQEGFVKIEDNLLKLTQQGYALCDSITVEIVHALEQEWEKHAISVS